jgi:hypothetical protein
MSRRALSGVIAVLVALTATGTALAQNYPPQYAPGYTFVPQLGPRLGWERGGPPDKIGSNLLPPRVIIGSLFQRGYRDVQIKRVRGDSYIVVAAGPDGGRVLMVVDGHTTEITGLRQTGWDRPPRQWDNEGWLPPRPWGGPRW